jgi:signal transduction histidine kinase
LLAQRRVFIAEGLANFAADLVGAAGAFLLYGLVGQFVTHSSPLFPATFINETSFQATFGVPIQLFRALMAIAMAFFTIRALRALEVNWRRRLLAAQQETREAVERRDALRGELLRRSVAAQEEERSRIARELHDEIGQVLTGLAAGLRGVQQMLATDPQKVRLQLRQLEGMTVRAITELGHLVSDLRPSLLDDMGLHAALGWYVEQVNQRGDAQIELLLEGPHCRLAPEIETTMFRIAQESLTNVLRHAQARYATLTLLCGDDKAMLQVKDDGGGFDTAAVMETEGGAGWGLIGIQERVQLAGGEFHIQSVPGEGTTLKVEIPLLSQRISSEVLERRNTE